MGNTFQFAVAVCRVFVQCICESNLVQEMGLLW